MINWSSLNLANYLLIWMIWKWKICVPNYTKITLLQILTWYCFTNHLVRRWRPLAHEKAKGGRGSLMMVEKEKGVMKKHFTNKLLESCCKISGLSWTDLPCKIGWINYCRKKIPKYGSVVWAILTKQRLSRLQESYNFFCCKIKKFQILASNGLNDPEN